MKGGLVFKLKTKGCLTCTELGSVPERNCVEFQAAVSLLGRGNNSPPIPQNPERCKQKEMYLTEKAFRFIALKCIKKI